MQLQEEPASSGNHLAFPSALLAGRYRLRNEIGSGGMATVHLADDLKYQRPVAIKIMRREIAGSVGSERFLREIRIVATLNHPHIVPLFDSGDAQGLLYYVMPYVAGGSLRGKLRREQQLTIEDGTAITKQIARALDHAHRQGVLHRDVKPENILFQDGQALLTDFGIGSLQDPGNAPVLTETGTFVGTVEYMSPEQASDEQSVGVSSDVYSLGCVLYEMLTGEPPHTGRTALAILAKRLVDPARPVRRLRPSVSSTIDQALMKALARVPADRFPSAAMFASALDAPPPSEARRRSTAVLPFANITANPDDDYFADGMTEDVIAQLSRIRGLKVISRTSVMVFKNRRESLRAIGKQLGVETVLEGSVRRSGERVRIVAQLIDADTDQHLWAETFDRHISDVLDIQSEIARRIAVALEVTLGQSEEARLRAMDVASEAYDLFLRGKEYTHRGHVDALDIGIDFFERALEVSPAFAAAHAALAQAQAAKFDSFGISHALLATALSTAQHAIALDAQLAEAHHALGCVYGAMGRYALAREAFERAVTLSPSYGPAIGNLGTLCGMIGQPDEAIEWSLRAISLDPQGKHGYLGTIALAYAELDLTTEGRQALDEALRLRPDHPRTHLIQSLISLLSGDHAAAVVQAVTLSDAHPSAPFYTCNAGATHLFAGDYEEAVSYLQRAYESGSNSGALDLDVRVLLAVACAKTGRSSTSERMLEDFDNHAAQQLSTGDESSTVLYSLGVAAAMRGQRKDAIAWLNRAIDGGQIHRELLLRNPGMEVLRSDAGFTELIDRLSERLRSMRHRAARLTS
jgi:serine/threonine protein kinase/tetratricopeptide (TPR) repeat protein